jgi:hypothetical protein
VQFLGHRPSQNPRPLGKQQHKRRIASRLVGVASDLMADAEIKAEIVFAGDETLRVQDTPEQIKHAIAAVRTPHIPLIPVTSQEGDEIWLNANHIRVQGVRPVHAFSRLR